MQRAEYDWPTPSGTGRFKPEHPVTKLEGDYDVFRDGSVTIIATPGHTPGHQSLFLKLPKTGPILLSGDLYHYPEERTYKRVPSSDFDVDQTAKSRAMVEEFLTKSKAELWIQHDYTTGMKRKIAPDFYE